MDELKERIERLPPERRDLLRKLAPDEYAGLFPPAAPVSNEIEARLQAIWSEVLAVPVARDSNYFELGGDSILSVAIVAKARAAGLQITPRLLFANPTVEQLAAALHEQAPMAASQRGGAAEPPTAPLTALQQGMVFHSLNEPGSAAYVSQLSCTLPGGVDRQRVEQAWLQLTQRHVVLRSAVDLEEILKPALRAHAAVRPLIEFRRLDGNTPQEVQTAFERFLEEDLAREFDLGTPPLMRLTMLESALDEIRCVWTHHHLLLDGWSQQILIQEFQRLYMGQQLPPVTTSFFDYAAWSASRDATAAEAFWRDYLQAAEPTRLPQHARHDATAAQDRVVARIPDATDRLAAGAQRLRVTPAIILEAAWALTLGELLHASNVTFGLTATVRPAELDSEHIVGLCINTLPLRASIPQQGTVGEWLTSLQRVQHDWLHHAHASLPNVLRWGHASLELFDSLFVFENLPKMVQASGTSDVHAMQDVRSTVRENYPLVLVVTPGRELVAELKYSRAIIARSQATQALELFACALQALDEELEMVTVRARMAERAHAQAQAAGEDRRAGDRHRLRNARRAPLSVGRSES